MGPQPAKTCSSNALWILVGGITPAIGGVVATLFGVPSLYVATVVFYLTSLVPMSQLKDISMPSSRKALSLKQIKSDLLANAAFNIDDVASGSVWTIFIFLFLKSYAEVGILASVTLLATILISLYMGWRQKDSRLHRYIRFGTGMTGLTNFLRVLVQAPLHISGVNFFQGAGKSLALTPYLTRYYLNAEKQGIPYITAMLAAGALACTVYFGILTLLTLLINVKIVALIGLLLGAPGILLAARIK